MKMGVDPKDDVHLYVCSEIIIGRTDIIIPQEYLSLQSKESKSMFRIK
jgi:hypothetical protein